MEILDSLYDPFVDMQLVKKLIVVVFSGGRERTEDMLTYTGRKVTSLLELDKLGCVLPMLARGIIMLLHARLNERALQDVRTWTGGVYDEKKVLQALTKLDISFGNSIDGKNTIFWLDDDEDDAKYYGEADCSYDNALLYEGDLDDEIDEEEAIVLLN